MDWQMIFDFLENQGFAIFVAIFLLVDGRETRKKETAALQELKGAIDSLKDIVKTRHPQ